MNKRINELMLESGYAAPELAGRANKLAELIIRECVIIVADAVDHREPASTYVGKIKEHFGVENEINQQLRNRSTYFGNNP